MKKIVITSFVMSHELDDLERVLVDLNKASKFVDGNNYEFYISFSVSDYLFDWENSKVDKQFFIDRFNSLKPLTDWAGKSTYQIRDEIFGAFQTKRYAHLESKDATHFIWLDTDICFDERILFYMENAINVLDEEKIDKYFVTPEIVKYWDTTWDCLVNQKFMDKELDYCKTNNITSEDISCGYGTLIINSVLYNFTYTPSSLNSLLASLNALGFGFFCSETIGGNTYIYTTDDTNVYGDLTLCGTSPTTTTTSTTTSTTTAAPTTTTTTSTTTAAPTTITTTSTTTLAPITCSTWTNLSGIGAFYDWTDCNGTVHLNEQILNNGTICAQDGSVSYVSGGTLTQQSDCTPSSFNLSYSAVDGATACSNYPSTITYYSQNGLSLAINTPLYTDFALTTPVSNGYYSDEIGRAHV